MLFSGVVSPWLTDRPLPLIPQPLLPQGEKGSEGIAGGLKAPLPLWATVYTQVLYGCVKALGSPLPPLLRGEPELQYALNL